MTRPEPADVAIRRARARDLDCITELWLAMTLEHASLDPAFALRSDAGERVHALLARLLADRDVSCLVWEAQGDLRGFCLARIERAPPVALETERGTITDLAVRNDSRRRGIGRALVEAALGWMRARGVARVEVRVAARNRSGQAFWRALGFDDFVDVLGRRL